VTGLAVYISQFSVEGLLWALDHSANAKSAVCDHPCHQNQKVGTVREWVNWVSQSSDSKMLGSSRLMDLFSKDWSSDWCGGSVRSELTDKSLFGGYPEFVLKPRQLTFSLVIIKNHGVLVQGFRTPLSRWGDGGGTNGCLFVPRSSRGRGESIDTSVKTKWLLLVQPSWTRFVRGGNHHRDEISSAWKVFPQREWVKGIEFCCWMQRKSWSQAWKVGTV
jgi:hypothetical protein